MKNNQFGAAVRSVREGNGISLRELARRLGWSAAYVSDIERGRRSPPGDEEVVWAWGEVIGAKDVGGLIKLAARGRPRPCGDCPLKGEAQ